MAVFSGSRKWVYPQSIQGLWQKVHRWSSLIFHLFLVVTPWIYIGGHPAFRLDLPDRRLYLLGQVFTAADGLFVALLGLSAAFMLFFVTALFGRVWCGYICPQTVLMEEWVRPIEKFFEGDRAERQKRDAGPWNVDRIWRRGAKWGAFLLVAFLISMSFSQWFAGAYEVWTFQAGPVDYTLVAIFTGLWFADFAWFREQLCNYVCPYARFQGALTDRHSLIISYDAARGEPRAKGKAQAQKGGCIDCNKCVVVCPQGIDIRNGFQLECIACGRCIDACQTVMPKFGHKTLVRYSTQAVDEGQVTRLIRPRTLVYAGLLTTLGGAILALALTHSPIEASINRAAGTHFVVDPDGFVRNTFILRVANNDAQGDGTQYQVRLEGLDGAEVQVPPISLDAIESATVPVIVRVPQDRIHLVQPFTVTVSSPKDEITLTSTFRGPGGSAAHGG
jgi:cytochrome c oxidase accessory protein FixG